MTTERMVPKYVAVREHLRERIRSMDVASLLPPEPQLCDEYEVSRITLRKAVDGLVADGLLVREQGRGTVVQAPALTLKHRESFVHQITGFYGEMTARGHRVETQVLTQRTRPAGAEIGGFLSLHSAEPVVEIVRLRSVDGSRHHLVHTYLPHALFPGALEVDLTTGSLYTYLIETYAARLTDARMVVEIDYASADEAALLGLPAASPLLVVHTTVRNDAERPIVYGFSRLRPESSQVEFEISAKERDAP